MAHDRNLGIRPEEPDDYAAVEVVVAQAFGRQEEPNLVKALRSTLPGPVYSLVAVLDKKLVGHILFSPITIEGEHETIQALALAPLAVGLEQYGGCHEAH